MTSFHYRLERVLAFRRTQFQVADSECRQAEARLRTAQAQHAALAARKAETKSSVARQGVIAGRTLAPLTDWFRWTENEDIRYKKLESAFSQELQKRRQTLIEAHRRVQLLEKLRDSRQAEWQTRFDREVEEIAADAINSRYVRIRKR